MQWLREEDFLVVSPSTSSALNLKFPQIGFEMKSPYYKLDLFKEQWRTSDLQPVTKVRLHLFSISSISNIHSRNCLVRPQKLLEDKDEFTNKIMQIYKYHKKIIKCA